MRQHVRRRSSPGPALGPMLEPLEPRQVLAVGTQTTLVATSHTSVLGETVTYSAQVTPQTPTTEPIWGMMRFRLGSTLLAKVPVDTQGRAAFDINHLYIGLHAITARFVANTDFGTSLSNGVGLQVSEGTFETTPEGLKKATVEAGSGTAVHVDQHVQVNYTGYLANGTKFDSSLNPGRTPFVFKLGANAVIDGWDLGVPGMKVGETRVLIVPPSLGYGSQGQGQIPPNATLWFIISMIRFSESDDTVLLTTGANAKPILSGAAPSNQNGTGFGAQPVGTTSRSVKFVFSSGTEANLQFTQTPPITITGRNPGQFTLSEVQGGENNTAFVTVTFNPTFAGFKKARLNVFTNDVDLPTFTILLRGSAV